MDINSRTKLNNGTSIPVIGLGVFRNPSGASTQNAVLSALNNGYRHIDTAKIYGNEKDVGIAVKNSGLPRKDLFLTTKLWNSDQGFQSTLSAFEESLNELQVDYIDLYLMHWPVEELRLESWRAMEEILSSGKAKALGVSNFMKKHLRELLENSDTMPAVNQIELSPYNYLYRKDTVDMCLENDIILEAYSPLTKGRKLSEEKLLAMADKYNKSAAQILIRWSLEHGFVVLPKSIKEQRIIENSDVFDFKLLEEDMQKLDGLNENLVTGWDPTDVK